MSTDPVTWSLLVKGARKGEEVAYLQLIEASQVRLFRFLFSLTHERPLAEDLCQEVYLKVFERLHQLKESDQFLSWLFTVARNVFLDSARQKKRHAEVSLTSTSSDENGPTEIDASAMSPETQQLRSGGIELNLSVRSALAHLEPEARAALLLVDMEGYSYLEAAKMTGISEGAMRSRLHRARQIFVKIYEEANETK